MRRQPGSRDVGSRLDRRSAQLDPATNYRCAHGNVQQQRRHVSHQRALLSLPVESVPRRRPSAGFLQSITLSADQHLLREQRSKLTATLRAGGGPVHSVNIAYYDGNPATNGQLLDLQRVAYMDPNQNYSHRAFYTPETCGIHQLYATAWLDDSPGIIANFPVGVTIQPTNDVDALIAATKAADFSNTPRSCSFWIC